jgi:hypothetical protein
MKTLNLFKFTGLLVAMACIMACSSENKAALDKFIAGENEVLVCPVHILDNQNSSYDIISSKKIVDYINDNNYANASLTQLSPPPNNTWQRNEAKMLTISIDLFVEYIKAMDLPDDTYILYPEFLKAGPNSDIFAVHYCLLNHEGEIAMRELINSLWEEFQEVDPKTNEDCVAVLINGFENKINK